MNTEHLHIAIVDDEESVRVALGRVLRWAGHDVAIHPSGDDFLASSQWPDCLVLDLHMPSISGFELQGHLAALGVRLPVIIITGHDTIENRQRALASGAVAYLLKPVDGQSLLAAISSTVSKESIL